MKSTLKKMLALLLALVMVLGTLAACDTTEPQQTTDPNASNQTEPNKETDPPETEPQLEPVTLNWLVFAGEKEGSKDVEEAFNAKLATVLPNTTVKFTYGTVGSYGTNWSMAMNGGTSIDMAWGGYATPMLQDTKDGNLLPLDDLIAEYAPNIVADKELFAQQYNTAVWEGQMYGIPHIQPVMKTTQHLSMDAEFFDKYFDSKAFLKEIRSTTKLTYKMLDIYEEAILAAIADGYIKLGDTDYTMPDGLTMATRGYMLLAEEKYHMWFDPEAENPVPMHTYELPEVQMLIDRYAKWYDLGWYTDKEIVEGMKYQKIDMSVSVAYNSNWAGDTDGTGIIRNDNSASNRRDTVTILLQTEDETYVGPNNYGGESSYWVIPYTAKNPERAMMLINLLHDEVGTVGNELYMLMANGFKKDSEEHKKYGWFNYDISKSADGQDTVDTKARGDAPNMHSMYNWAIANTYRALYDNTKLLTVQYKEYCLSFYDEVFPNLRKTPLAGMIPDTTPVANELAAMLNVEAEYNKQLGFGTAGEEGIDELYDKVMAAMAVAGLNIVKGELQDQIDDYIAKNK